MYDGTGLQQRILVFLILSINSAIFCRRHSCEALGVPGVSPLSPATPSTIIDRLPSGHHEKGVDNTRLRHGLDLSKRSDAFIDAAQSALIRDTELLLAQAKDIPHPRVGYTSPRCRSSCHIGRHQQVDMNTEQRSYGVHNNRVLGQLKFNREANQLKGSENLVNQANAVSVAETFSRRPQIRSSFRKKDKKPLLSWARFLDERSHHAPDDPGGQQAAGVKKVVAKNPALAAKRQEQGQVRLKGAYYWKTRLNVNNPHFMAGNRELVAGSGLKKHDAYNPHFMAGNSGLVAGSELKKHDVYNPHFMAGNSGLVAGTELKKHHAYNPHFMAGNSGLVAGSELKKQHAYNPHFMAGNRELVAGTELKKHDAYNPHFMSGNSGLVAGSGLKKHDAYNPHFMAGNSGLVAGSDLKKQHAYNRNWDSHHESSLVEPRPRVGFISRKGIQTIPSYQPVKKSEYLNDTNMQGIERKTRIDENRNNRNVNVDELKRYISEVVSEKVDKMLIERQKLLRGVRAYKSDRLAATQREGVKRNQDHVDREYKAGSAGGHLKPAGARRSRNKCGDVDERK